MRGHYGIGVRVDAVAWLSMPEDTPLEDFHAAVERWKAANPDGEILVMDEDNRRFKALDTRKEQ